MSKDYYSTWRIEKDKTSDNKNKKILVWGNPKHLTTIEIGRGGKDWYETSYYAYGGPSGNDSLRSSSKEDIKDFIKYYQKEFEEKIPPLKKKMLKQLDILDDGDWGIYGE